MIDRRAYRIVISPIGEIEPGLCQQIQTHVERIFGSQTELVSLLSDVDFALHPQRRQFNSTVILAKLAEMMPAHTGKVIAITQLDLFIPILTYVYGEAQLGGKAAIISLFRLLEGFTYQSANPSIEQRAIKEAVHELGHTFNLRHCPEKTCIMHYCRSIRDVDRKSDQLCRHCSVLLEDEFKRLGLK